MARVLIIIGLLLLVGFGRCSSNFIELSKEEFESNYRNCQTYCSEIKVEQLDNITCQLGCTTAFKSILESQINKESNN